MKLLATKSQVASRKLSDWRLDPKCSVAKVICNYAVCRSSAASGDCSKPVIDFGSLRMLWVFSKGALFSMRQAETRSFTL